MVGWYGVPPGQVVIPDGKLITTVDLSVPSIEQSIETINRSVDRLRREVLYRPDSAQGPWVVQRPVEMGTIQTPSAEVRDQLLGLLSFYGVSPSIDPVNGGITAEPIYDYKMYPEDLDDREGNFGTPDRC